MHIALLMAPWLDLVCRIISPFVIIFEWSTKKIVSLFYYVGWFKEIPIHETPSVGLEELSLPGREYVLNIIKIEKTKVTDILLGWPEVISAEASQSLEQVENTIISSGHTRLPVVKGQEVIGIINAKEFLAFKKAGKTEWQSLIRPALKIQDNTDLILALLKLQQQRAHIGAYYL